jgi:hypothetical protein
MILLYFGLLVSKMIYLDQSFDGLSLTNIEFSLKKGTGSSSLRSSQKIYYPARIANRIVPRWWFGV